MKKATMLLLLAISLLAAAVGLSVPSLEAARCHPPDCFASPGCCVHRDCDAFCGGPGLGYCGASQCCDCAAI